MNELKSKRIDRWGQELANVSLRIPMSEYKTWQGAAKSNRMTLTQVIRQGVLAWIDNNASKQHERFHIETMKRLSQQERADESQ